MLRFLIRRLAWALPTLAFASVLVFVVMELPPGDYLSTYVARLRAEGGSVDQATVLALERQFGLDRPFVERYGRWITRFVQGDLGVSFRWNQPARDLLLDRLGYTLLVTVSTLLFTWAVAIPIGIYGAVRRNTLGDHAATFVGFIGLAIPNFLFALVLMFLSMRLFGVSVGGLVSPQMHDEPWGLPKILDLLVHLWIPIVVLGTAGTAGLVRVLRANLADELTKPYVVAARARGERGWTVVRRYPLRIAFNPLISTVGYTLPELFSGATITAIVLGLPTVGPLLLEALLLQDMYLAGSVVMVLAILTVAGTVVSDVLLAALDPRIRVR